MKRAIAGLIEKHELAIVVVSVLLIAVIVDIVVLVAVFPLFEDRVTTGWNPESGQATRSLKAGVLITVDILLFASAGWAFSAGLRRLKRKWSRE